jgi:NCAIR mutase (PurE)-related protein
MDNFKKGQLDEILEQVKNGAIGIDEAKEKLKTFDELGFATLDLHREKRQGFPEVIYGDGKTAEHIIAIINALKEKTNRIIATRVSSEKADQILSEIPEMKYDSLARVIHWKHKNEKSVLFPGYCAVVCAGTSDLAVAEEAALTLEMMGCAVERINDVGVAGIHRLFAKIDVIRGATVSVVVAGMEGALPSAVGGLVSNPIIAVPTSVGYGANFQGLSALLTMLNSCASGISVVNIDNGFGAGYNAGIIHRLVHQPK